MSATCETGAVTSQPATILELLASDQVPGEGDGPVIVRQMTRDDSEFAGIVTVEGFQSKLEWAAGKSRMEQVVKLAVNDYETMADSVYKNIFIASYSGERAGLVALRCHGDRDMAGSANFGSVSCRTVCGLWCMVRSLDEGNLSPDECYLGPICVDSKFRGKGVGKVLLDRADYEAKKRGCTSIYLNVTGSNRAKNLYERQGYVISKDENRCLAYCTVGARHWYQMRKVY